MPRRLRSLAALLGALLAAVPLVTAPASAGVLDVTCTAPSSEAISYQPALTSTTQPVTVTISSQYGVCVSATVPSLTSGTAYLQAPGIPLSCQDLLLAGPVYRTITWNTGQSSTLSGNLTSTITGGVVVATITGTVTAGLFQGDTFVYLVTAPATSILLCTIGLGTVSSVYGLVTLEITSL
ncbi:hypothetical protein [Nonomuraea sp. PA05]|uniref:hypothetical protein n=1 Tax=Nonomuraea sp. PA05 TaxID=2604466 RepID=UPI0021CCCB19|nr:hypothetical protein [Nonomuraea sp. PA05]